MTFEQNSTGKEMAVSPTCATLQLA